MMVFFGHTDRGTSTAGSIARTTNALSLGFVRLPLLLLACLLLAPTTGCRLLGLSPTQCQDDANCPFGQVCSARVCVDAQLFDAGALEPDPTPDPPDAGDAGAVDGGQNLDAGPVLDGGPTADAGPVLDGGPIADAGVAIDGGYLPDAGSVPDGGPNVDAGAPDAGVPVDAGVPDAGAPADAGGPDAGDVDAGGPDAGATLDAGILDAGAPDAGVVDAGVQACIDATVATFGSTNGTTRGLDSSIRTTCGEGPSGEVVYVFSAGSSDVGVRVLVESGDVADHIIEVRGTCEDPSTTETCVDEAGFSGTDQATFTALANVDYFLIVDTYQDRDGSFDMLIEEVEPLIDVCANAPALVGQGGTVNGNLMGAFNHFDAESFGLQCTGWESPGGDNIFSVQLAAGAVFNATLEHNGDEVIYLLDDCAQFPAATCLVGADEETNAETIIFTAKEAGVFYVVVDSYRQYHSGFEMVWSVTDPP